MIEINRKSLSSLSLMRTLLLHFVLILFTTVILAVLMHSHWINNLSVYHTVLELICVFIALSIFTSIWFTDSSKIASNYVLCFGYLVIAIFDILHVFYHFKLNLTANAYFDLSTKYWILGRLTEALVLFVAIKVLKVRFNKWLNLAIALTIAGSISYFMIAYHDYLPVLLTISGVTPIKIFFEYFIILIYLYCLYSLRNKLDVHGMVTYKYIFVSILMSITSEFCFTIYSSVESISWTIGHMLKITSYFYLFRGIFISTVIYPYNELELKNKKLEAANIELIRMSENMSDLLDAIPIAIQKYDEDGSLKYVNKKFVELLECDREQVLGASMQVMDETAVTSYADEEQRSENDKYANTSVVRIFRSITGKSIKLSLNTHKLRNGSLVLINETKREQELQNLHIQTETILASVGSGVLVTDEEKKIVLFNKAFEDIYQVDKKEIVGMSIDRLNEITEFELKDLPNMVINDQLDKHEYIAKLTSFMGVQKELEIYVAPIRNVDGEIIGAISIATDITEKKKEQERILQQEKLALLGQMGAGIVHETRNFLTTIKGRCQLIGMMATDDSIKKHAAKINTDVDEINRIISEFLFLSKPKETELLEISIHDMFASIKGMIETSSLVKGVDIDFLLSEEEHYILCDESQMKQVILNICKNAIDAMSEQQNAKLIVKTGYDNANNEMFISITDNGKGIPEEEIKKLGTPFFTTKSNGTGLGLSVCFKIIKEHGGRIEVDSTVGIGTTFKMILPCIDEESGEVL